MKMKLSLVGLATLVVGSALAVPVYENDFTTRTSAPIPTGEWLELPYVVGNLAEDYRSTAPDGVTPFNNGAGFQDSWFKAIVGRVDVPVAYVVSVNSSERRLATRTPISATDIRPTSANRRPSPRLSTIPSRRACSGFRSICARLTPGRHLLTGTSVSFRSTPLFWRRRTGLKP